MVKAYPVKIACSLPQAQPHMHALQCSYKNTGFTCTHHRKGLDQLSPAQLLTYWGTVWEIKWYASSEMVKFHGEETNYNTVCKQVIIIIICLPYCCTKKPLCLCLQNFCCWSEACNCEKATHKRDYLVRTQKLRLYILNGKEIAAWLHIFALKNLYSYWNNQLHSLDFFFHYLRDNHSN